MLLEHKTIVMVEPGYSPTSESEFHKYGHGKVSVVTTRIPITRLTNAGLSSMIEELPLAIQGIVSARPGVIAINSFTGSCLKGPEMVNMVQQLTGAPAIVPAAEMIRHLSMLGARRIALVSPFGTEFNMLERIYFNLNDIEIATIVPIHTTLNLLQEDDPYLANLIRPSTVVSHVREADLSGIDAVVLDSPTFALDEMVDDLERIVDVPILSTNQILLYSAFTILGVPTDHLVVSKYMNRAEHYHRQSLDI